MSDSYNGAGQEISLAALVHYWKACFASMWWTAKRYWPVTILSLGLLISDRAGAVEPAGAGFTWFVSWLLMFCVVAQDRALTNDSDE